MNKDLERVREIFLTEVDEETRADNEAKIREWEQSLLDSESLLSFREHDITKEIGRRAKDTYRDLCMVLATNRELTQAQRESTYAKQDAALWIISLVEQGDPKDTIARIEEEIRVAISAF